VGIKPIKTNKNPEKTSKVSKEIMEKTGTAKALTFLSGYFYDLKIK